MSSELTPAGWCTNDTDHTIHSYPKLLSQVAQQLKQCNNDLDALPREVGGEPCLYVFNVVSAFCADVKKYVYGSTTCATLVQTNNNTYDHFKLMMTLTQPPFIPHESSSCPSIDIIGRFVPSPPSSHPSIEPVYLDDVRDCAARCVLVATCMPYMRTDDSQLSNTRASA